VDELRIRLIERLCRLESAHLPRVELFLNSLKDTVLTAAPKDVVATPRILESAGHKDWPHAPPHRLSEHGTFIVTASTLNKQHLFRGAESLTLLENELLRLAKEYGVVLEAWAVFSNHFHVVAHTAGVANQLATFLSHLHTSTAAEINRRDGTPGRQVWFNFRDTELTFEKSYFARLNYVIHNAVKHGLVTVANQYPWCSAAWFERTATAAQIKTIYSFKYDRISIEDDFDPVM
jgi:putative transposase